ncbi:MAG TPA: GNAT family protein, partial [Pseudomonadales bacterium]|nr:GNAT family protein [Pseudomonadales bacterium]
TEATVALAQFGFDYLRLLRIEIVMSVRNTASRRVAEKAGGQFEGILANRLYLHGEAHDARLYSLTPDLFDPRAAEAL